MLWKGCRSRSFLRLVWSDCTVVVMAAVCVGWLKVFSSFVDERKSRLLF